MHFVVLTRPSSSRKRQRRVLEAYVGTSKVGMYCREPGGGTSFCYTPEWLSSERQFPISMSMPLSDRIWSGEKVASYFDGLLPDSRTTREKIATRVKAAITRTFDLLAAVGSDCVGALRFVPEGFDTDSPVKQEFRKVDDKEIASRIASLVTAPLGVQGGKENFRLSIAGEQQKTAFLRINNQWHLPIGPTPTSHIFKPPMRNGQANNEFSDMPWNEWLCLEFCRNLGLDAAIAEGMLFDNKPVIVVERFERIWHEGVIYRLPQEDMCQALGILPFRKYQAYGGPGIVDILKFMNGAIAPHESRMAFMKTQIVYWLLAAIDGHAKNFSIFLSPDGYRLTPLYDVASSSSFPEFPDQKIKVAMAWGNSRHYRLNEIQLRHFHQTGKKAGFHEPDMDGFFSDLLVRMDDAANKTVAMAIDAGVPTSTSTPILEGINKGLRIIERG